MPPAGARHRVPRRPCRGEWSANGGEDGAGDRPVEQVQHVLPGPGRLVVPPGQVADPGGPRGRVRRLDRAGAEAERLPQGVHRQRRLPAPIPPVDRGRGVRDRADQAGADHVGAAQQQQPERADRPALPAPVPDDVEGVLHPAVRDQPPGLLQQRLGSLQPAQPFQLRVGPRRKQAAQRPSRSGCLRIPLDGPVDESHGHGGLPGVCSGSSGAYAHAGWVGLPSRHRLRRSAMPPSDRAGQPAAPADLVDVPRLVTAYYAEHPDAGVPEQRVAFGTSGHRGSALSLSFNSDHIVATSQAICEYRAGAGIDGPLFLGKDTHALSEPAFVDALEVFAANEVRVLVDPADRVTPTPALSHAILAHNRGRSTGLADGVVVTPSHNPPTAGGSRTRRPGQPTPPARTTTWPGTSATCPRCWTWTRSASAGCRSVPTRSVAPRCRTGARSASGTASTSPW